jgi:hypothetical protein
MHSTRINQSRTRVRFQDTIMSNSARTEEPIATSAPPPRSTQKSPRRTIRRTISRLLRHLKHLLDNRQRSRTPTHPPKANPIAKSSRSSPSSQVKDTSRKPRLSLFLPFKRYFSTFKRWRRRKLTRAHQDTENNNKPSQPAVDWNTIDLQALDPLILQQNTEAMRSASREAAETLRRESGWIREHEAFDDHTWVERERDGDNEDWETDDDDDAKVTRLISSSTSRRPNPSITRKPLNNLPRGIFHHHSGSRQYVPSLHHSDSSPLSSIAALTTPQMNAIRPLRDSGDALVGQMSGLQRKSPSHLAGPVIVVYDWDEEMTHAGNTSSTAGLDEVAGRPQPHSIQPTIDFSNSLLFQYEIKDTLSPPDPPLDFSL